ncbi:MAG: exo-alpha-sialidase [Planctomycetota bacterium]|nr:MAG: exo-alpha-sialidase [Planctomycetota bacterium]
MVERIQVGTRKGLFTLRRVDGAWAIDDEVAFLGVPVPMLHHDARDGADYAALDHGHFGSKLHRRDAGGEWIEVGVPSYPEKPEGEDDLGAQDRAPIPWALKLTWALESAGPDRPGSLWCGTLPGGLFRSDDRGDSWQLVESLWNMPERREWFGGGADWPGIHSVCVDPRDSRRVVIGISCGGVWLSEDAGQTWACRATGMRAEYLPPEQQHEPNLQDPHRVVQCPSAPDVYWTQHHNGIFRSGDGCASWQEITTAKPTHFGFAVAVHPNDPDTAWFVPAVKDDQRFPGSGQVVVSRTRDGGQSFEVLRQGLPQRHAYDLVYRHALAVDASGSTLVFGSTTGSLWISEDGGDSWSTLSEHLPPVYVVKLVE